MKFQIFSSFSDRIEYWHSLSVPLDSCAKLIRKMLAQMLGKEGSWECSGS